MCIAYYTTYSTECVGFFSFHYYVCLILQMELLHIYFLWPVIIRQLIFATHCSALSVHGTAPLLSVLNIYI